MSNWTDNYRSPVQLLNEIELPRTRKDNIDNPFYQDHQSAIAESVDQAEKKAQQQPCPIRPGETPDSSKKQCHLILKSMWPNTKQARVFVGFFAHGIGSWASSG